MAYQRVGTPIFYVCTLSWLKSIGELIYVGNSLDSSPDKETKTMQLIGLNPSRMYFHNLSSPNNENDTIIYKIPNVYSNQAGFQNLSYPQQNWCAILGHNLHSANCSFNGAQEAESPWTGLARDSYVNWVNESTVVPYNGWTLTRGNNANFESNAIQFRFDARGDADETAFGTYSTSTLNIGSIGYGNYYKMHNHPDLKITMERQYDGVKSTDTLGGSTLTNSNWNTPSRWGSYRAWGLYKNPTHKLNQMKIETSGRRVWNLKFSYIDAENIFPMLSQLSAYESTSATGEVNTDTSTWHNDETLNRSNNFYSQVIHKTNGGHLPFIFPPDSENKNRDSFAIAKLDMNSFKFTQSAYNVYDISLKIREVW